MGVDAIVIGSGQGGVPLAVRLAESGWRVLLVERGDLGGTCINTGCTPTKTLVASAQAAHDARAAGRLGVHAAAVTVDFAAVMRRVRDVRTQWRAGVAKRLEKQRERLTVVRGHGRFVGPRRVEAGGEAYDAEVVVLNVGGRPVVPPIPGLDGVPFLTSGSILEITELPRHLVVLGGGYIGCEMGQAFRRLGAEVTLIDGNAHLMSREDEELSTALEGAFRDDGVALRLGSGVASVEAAEGGVRVRLKDGTAVDGSHLLVATGRRPNTGDLGCEEGGVALDDHGFVTVDDGFRASAPGVFAIGDCVPGPQFTHESWDDGRILFDILTGARTGGRGGRVVPYTAFTDPQLARVGLSEREAKERGIEYEMATMPFGSIARAIESGLTAGVARVLVDPRTERILGAAVVGAQAGELIHIFSTVMAAGATARAIVDAQFVHPTFAEGMQTLVMRLDRYALRPRPRAAREPERAGE